jgi:hypothetical protein
LPESIVRGKSVFLPDGVIKRMFTLADLVSSDIFYDLDCTKSNAVAIAAREYKVKKAIGIADQEGDIIKIRADLSRVENVSIVKKDIHNLYLKEADVVFFWLYDESTISSMLKKIELECKKQTRIVSVWSPPGMLLPDKVDFPFFICRTPLRYAKDIQTQFKAIYGQECIDFTGCWMLGDKYVEGIEIVPYQYKRFVNILYSMIIWINAWNMHLTCEEQIPPPVESYLGILRTFFNIDLSDMFEKGFVFDQN